MTQEEFIAILDEKGYSYKIKEDKLVVTGNRHVNLSSFTSLPPGVEFKNGGDVYLDSLKTLSPDVEFRNGGSVYLDVLTSLPPSVVFMNGGHVVLDSLENIPPGTEFRNGGSINLRSLTGDYFFHEWSGNIEGIDSKRLLNVMIKRGMFI